MSKFKSDSLDDAPPASGAPKLTVEIWAERKGFLPQFRGTTGPTSVVSSHNPEFWRFAAARAVSQWPIGAEVTEAEFDDAVFKATTGVSR